MTTYDHRIVISTHWADMRQLLEHIRYSDSRIRRVLLKPNDVNPEKFIIDLWYKGTKKGWEVIKGRAESIGLVVEEGYKTETTV